MCTFNILKVESSNSDITSLNLTRFNQTKFITSCQVSEIKFSTWGTNDHIQGTMSQISYLGFSFYFM